MSAFTINTKRTDTHGFTLVELAIALMVIGLLIGGVLKGQELIDNARVTAFTRQVKAYDAATMIFKSTYGSLPGDIKKPNRIPNCTTDSCNAAGDGNGKIRYNGSLSPPMLEQGNFFPHLTKAGMITGPEGGTSAQFSTTYSNEAAPESELFFPMTNLDLDMRIHYSDSRMYNLNSDGHYYRNYWIGSNAPPVKMLAAIDTKIDDGKPYVGDIGLLELGDCPSTEFPSNDPVQVSGIEYDMAYPTETECLFVVKTGW